LIGRCHGFSPDKGPKWHDWNLFVGQAQTVDQTYTYQRKISSSFTGTNKIHRFPMVNAPFAEMKIVYDLKILQRYTRKAYLLLEFWHQICVLIVAIYPIQVEQLTAEP
jgi:hypothetical protein